VNGGKIGTSPLLRTLAQLSASYYQLNIILEKKIFFLFRNEDCVKTITVIWHLWCSDKCWPNIH